MPVHELVAAGRPTTQSFEVTDSTRAQHVEACACVYSTHTYYRWRIFLV